MAVNHGTVPRALMATPRSQFHEGRFGRLFRHLEAFEPDDADLIELADMVLEKSIDVERVDDRPSNMVDLASASSSVKVPTTFAGDARGVLWHRLACVGQREKDVDVS